MSVLGGTDRSFWKLFGEDKRFTTIMFQLILYKTRLENFVEGINLASSRNSSRKREGHELFRKTYLCTLNYYYFLHKKKIYYLISLLQVID